MALTEEKTRTEQAKQQQAGAGVALDQQMLAMRNGNPCFVHNTGGLKDTVTHMKTGFCFGGNSYDEKIKNMLLGFDEVLKIFVKNKPKWKEIQENAKNQRFTWQKSVDQYYKYLYDLGN